MLQCLDSDPDVRPTAAELLARLGELVSPPSRVSLKEPAAQQHTPASSGSPRRIVVPPPMRSPFADQAAAPAAVEAEARD